MASDAAVGNNVAADSSEGVREGNASDAEGEKGRSDVLPLGECGVQDERMQSEQDASRSEDEQHALAIVPFEQSTGTAEDQAIVPFGAEGEEGKDGWEAAREWLWTLPRRRNVVYQEVEEWLQNNKHRLSREIVTMPRAHLFRFLVSQHKLMRRTDQKENLELVEPPTARFKRSDKWRPVYTWLEALDTGSVVGAKVIDAWLSKNPAIKEELLGKHTRHHLFHYIQKCHTNILKKRKKEVTNDSKIGSDEERKKTKKKKKKKKKTTMQSLFKTEVQLGHVDGTAMNRPDSFILGIEASQLQFKTKDNHGLLIHSHSETLPGGKRTYSQAIHISDRLCFENKRGDARDVIDGTKEENGVFTSKITDGLLHSHGWINSTQAELKNKLPLIVADHKAGDTKHLFEDKKAGMTSMHRAEARKRYEILLELRTQLFKQIARTREQMRIASAQETTSFLHRPSTSTAPFTDDYSQPGSSGAVLESLLDVQSMSNEDFEERSQRRSRDSARLQQEIANSSLSAQRSRSSVDGKKRKKGKEKFDNVVLSWSYSDFATESSSCSRPGLNRDFEVDPSMASHSKDPIRICLEKITSSQILGEKARHLKVACNPVRCLQEREKGAAIGSVTSPFQMIGRGRHCRWKSFLQGWDSLEKQFTGCAVWLQRNAFSSWLPCWSAYTSSVAVAAPLGMIDQGVQKVLDVRFHPHNFPQLVCSSNAAPNELLLYDLLAGRATELVGHNCQIQAVEYAADGRSIVSCGSNLVKIWDSNTGACLHTLGPGPWAENAVGHRKKINAMAVNEEQSDIVATSGGYGDSQLLLWNVNRGELACDLNGNLRKQFASLPSMDALEFCSQNLLVCGSDSTSGGPAVVQIWDVCAPEIVTSYPANDAYITSLKVDPAGTTIASGAGDGSVALFDLRTCRGIVRLPLGSSYEVTSVSFSSCGTYFQASSTANRTLVWDTRMLPMDPGPRPTENPLGLADRESRKTRALHCLSHGTPMPTSENAGQMTGFVDEGDQGVNDARWFHDTPVLVTVSGNGSIAMWDISLGDPCIRHLISHSRCVNTVAVSPNDKYICSGGDDQKVVLYQNIRDKSSSTWRLTHPLLENPIDNSTA